MLLCQVIQLSQEDVLYFRLVSDMTITIMAKIMLNHSLEVLSHLLGHLNDSACFALLAIGQGMDFLIMSYVLDANFIRSADELITKIFSHNVHIISYGMISSGTELFQIFVRERLAECWEFER